MAGFSSKEEMRKEEEKELPGQGQCVVRTGQPVDGVSGRVAQW